MSAVPDKEEHLLAWPYRCSLRTMTHACLLWRKSTKAHWLGLEKFVREAVEATRVAKLTRKQDRQV